MGFRVTCHQTIDSIFFSFLFSLFFFFSLVFSVSSFSIDTSQPSFLTSNNNSCLLNVPNSDTNPFDNAFDFGSDSCFLSQGFGLLTQLRNRDLSSVPDFLSSPENNNSTTLYGGGGGFTPSDSQGFTSLAKVLKPLEVLASSGAQPTLFQITSRCLQRRKKLNDRLYMLRSIFPKISKVNNHVSLYLLKVFILLLCCVVSDKLWFGLVWFDGFADG